MPTDATRKAMEVVRDYWGHKSVDLDKYEDGCELLARWLVANAGELVRKVKCDKCGGGGGTKCQRCGGSDAVNCCLRADPPCAMCDGNGYALEPLFGEGGK